MGKIGDRALVFLMAGVQKETLKPARLGMCVIPTKANENHPRDVCIRQESACDVAGAERVFGVGHGGKTPTRRRRISPWSQLSMPGRGFMTCRSLDDEAVVCRVKESAFWSVSVWNPELRPAHVA